MFKLTGGINVPVSTLPSPPATSDTFNYTSGVTPSSMNVINKYSRVFGFKGDSIGYVIFLGSPDASTPSLNIYICKYHPQLVGVLWNIVCN
ncbi:MAG: hypothetical protein EKK64_10135 [Neisseriaceae bacterium]|nr:MAG: hypothetical protein EKK64_10135 [Neisseriaceae bacterium]